MDAREVAQMGGQMSVAAMGISARTTKANKGGSAACLLCALVMWDISKGKDGKRSKKEAAIKKAQSECEG